MSWSKTKFNTAENGCESKKADGRKLCLAPAAFAIAISIALGGCSWTFLSSHSTESGPLKTPEDDIQTGSIAPDGDGIAPVAQLKNLSDEDWRRAKAALAVAVDPHGSTDRVLWDNPKTLAKGSFAPDGPPFVKNDEICRNFKTVVTDQEETKNLQGIACRPSGGEWKVAEIKAAPVGKPGNGKSAKPAADKAQTSVPPKPAAKETAKATPLSFTP